MAKLQSTEIVGVANRPATICSNTMCIWFDTTNLKTVISYCGYNIGVWSAGGTLITGRQDLAGVGTQNEGLVAGGYTTVGVACTEEYNGTSWAIGGALNIARKCLAGAGTQNAGLVAGGYACVGSVFDPESSTFVDDCNNVSCTEEYNGTSWSVGGVLITGRMELAGAGTQNVGLVAGGYCIFSQLYSCTEEYNGTSWSAGGALITARRWVSGAGTQNAGLATGGFSSATVTCTEEYNGTSWSAGGILITARSRQAAAGTQNEGLLLGGIQTFSPGVSCTEEYNGVSWSAGGALITARYGLAGAGTQSAGLAAGGYFACTEEYNKTLAIIDDIQ
jgi:hypothetical protein